ncbi:glycosyl hydrolase family 30 [Sphingobacteriales bacterium UPWRP_1]|nr:glycosyl hydrolase family 30 [Sphingobacteriales bacterium UPWRP_1]
MLTVQCNPPALQSVAIFETSEGGNRLTPITNFTPVANATQITLLPDETYQTITGFGGSFTQATAYLLQKLGEENRKKILEAYFGESGARYSLTRTHINSCDFSLYNYAYATTPADTLLQQFTIDEDRKYLIPAIKQAQAISKDGFRIIATPWTAPPWMKDNNSWRGGKLLPQYYPTWALYFSKYLSAYQAEGIPVWGVTVENEPLGNDSNWESMHFTPQEMNDLVKNHLGPKLKADGHEVKILGYDQNRDEELKVWVDAMYDDEAAAAYYAGTAIHWYASTYDYFPEALQYARQKAPGKHLIQTEACIDAQVPRWKNDAWYWSEEATDWGWNWAPPDKKHLHPKYVPVFRYAQDIIGCLNNWVDGWIDWNMVLDKQGGPNWAKNWCIAPVIADPDADEIYFTPLYYVMAHFSRFIRPGAVRIGFKHTDKDLMITAAKNPDNSIVLVLFNPAVEAKGIGLTIAGKETQWTLSPKAIQTIVLSNK